MYNINIKINKISLFILGQTLAILCAYSFLKCALYPPNI